MMKLLKCEYLKTRKRYVWITAFLITAFELIWALQGNYNDFILDNGWDMFLYELPVVNALFLPLLAMVIASRLADIEHKGATLKQLCAITPKGKLYDAKLIYGLAIVFVSLIIQFAGIILGGKFIGFRQEFPAELYMLFFIFTTAVTFVIYILQHILSLLFKNQIIPFCVGVIGEFIGIISLFLPSIPVLRKSVLWGYYGVLGFMGMFGWAKDTRYANVYYEVMNIDWTAFACLIVAGIFIYIIGRKIFCEKEI